MASFLLIFPTKEDKIENIVVDKKSGHSFIMDIVMTLERLDCEREAEIYINLENKNKFIEDYRTLEILLTYRIGSYDIETAIASFITQNNIRILISEQRNFDFTVALKDGFTPADQQLSIKNRDRKLNREDFRHCENHNDYRSDKSPLIGGTGGFDNAAEWLPSAIGDVRANRTILLNTDANNSKFLIRYEDEHFNNQYHAFHMVKNVNGNYIPDEKNIQLLKTSRKSLKRPLKLIYYRESKH